MDQETTTHAGDVLYEVVLRCAKQVFTGEHRRNQTPKDSDLMGGSQTGTHGFGAGELRTYCRTVIKQVNAELGGAFSLTISVKTSWTYGQTRDAIWNDCFKQMQVGAALLKSLGAAS